MDYFISDPHFNDKDIINYALRNFDDVEEMNERIISGWNRVIQEEDTVYVLGDLGIEIMSIVHNLPGKKILIIGNHDKENDSYYINAGFEQVIRGGLIYDNFFFLTHVPMYMNDSMPYTNIHGHIHRNLYAGKKYINVCVENTSYRPVSIQEIKDYLKDKERKHLI